MASIGEATFNLPEDLFDGDDSGGDDAPIERRPKLVKTAARNVRRLSFEETCAQQSAKVARRKERPKTISASRFDRTRAEVERMMKSGEYEGATATHLVAYYALLHERTYDVEPAELTPTARFIAVGRCAAFVKREFGGDYVDAVEFFQWVWEREMKREASRRQRGQETRRIGINFMFSGHLLTDFRLARRGNRD